MHQAPFPGLLRYVLCAVLIFSLAACHDTEVRKKSAPAKVYSASDYVEHLALAQLVPENRKADTDIINAYAAQKKKKSERQGILILTYKTADRNIEQVPAPIPLTKNSGEFTELREILTQLNKNGGTLQDIHIHTVTVAPAQGLKVAEAADKKMVATILNIQEEHLLARASNLKSVDSISTQLRLITFFISNRFRDAAYITVDNVKKLVAAMPIGIETETFSKELEALESELRKTMPYAL